MIHEGLPSPSGIPPALDKDALNFGAVHDGIHRMVALDVETTGLDPDDGHRLVEIAGVEIVGANLSGKRFHSYLNPGRGIDPGAQEVHGLTDAFLRDKPTFGQVVEELLRFIGEAECVVHNAQFIVSFLDNELAGEGLGPVDRHCRGIIDTLDLARETRPNMRNDKRALLTHYEISEDGNQGCIGGAEQTARLFLELRW